VPTRDPQPDWLLAQRQEVGARIRDLRIQANLTQEALAELVGVERRTINRIELGITSPPLDRILTIARALDVPPGGLMPDG
jgi:transcriptional regulator with XRE-family HTH domain